MKTVRRRIGGRKRSYVSDYVPPVVVPPNPSIRPVVPAVVQPGWGDATARMYAHTDLPEGSFYSSLPSSVLDPNCAAYSLYGPSSGYGQVRTYPQSAPGDNMPFGAPDSQTNVYAPARTLKTEDGWFKARLRHEMTDGVLKGLGVALIPTLGTPNKQRGGLFLWRVRADYMPGKGGVFQTIRLDGQTPAELKWPDSGEMDITEGSFDTPNLGGFNHFADPANKQTHPVTGTTWQYDDPNLVGSGGGQIWALEWFPSTAETLGTDGHIRWWNGVQLDANGTIIDMGNMFYETRDRVPGINHQFLMQSGRSGTQPPAGSESAGELKVAFMCSWKLPDGATDLPAPIKLGTASSYLSRSGTDITLNNQKWRGAGINWHWAGLRETTLTYPTHAMIDEILDECKSMGASFIRAHTLGMSAGLSQSLVTSINADGSLIWNNAAWEPIDYVVQQAKARGIRLMIPFTDQFNYYHKGKQWWVQQAFIQRATSNIPTTYTYNNGATTETNVTSFDPNSGSVSGSARYKVISQQFYRNTWIRNAFINNYVGPWFDHVNQYTGIANKNEPTIAFAQMGNELWDSGDQYADHAGADGVSCVAQFNAKVKSKQPGVLTIDPMGADGVDPNWAPGRNDVNEDIIDATHLYRNGQAITSGYVSGFAAKVAAFNKATMFGEYPINNSGLSIALAEMEQTSGIMGGAFWAIYSSTEGHTQGGVDDTVYVIGGNSQWKTQFQNHAAVMSSGNVPTAPVLTNLMKSATVANSEAASSNFSTGSSDTVYPTLATESGTGVSGSALKVTVATSSTHKWVYVNTPVTNGAPVTAGSTYTATAHVKLVSGTLSSGLYGHLTWYKSDGTYISGATSSGTVTASGTYQQVTFSGVAPANAAYAVPQIEFDGPASGTAVLLIDQWGVFAGNNASPWVSP